MNRIRRSLFAAAFAAAPLVPASAQLQGYLLPGYASTNPQPMLPDASNSAAYAGQNLTTNRAQLEHWRAALAQVRAGTGRARLLTVGDSTSIGAGAGTAGEFDLDGGWNLAWPARLATLLNAAGIPASNNALFGDQNASAEVSYPLYDTRVSLGAGWGVSTTTTVVVGGWLWTYQNGTASALNFTPNGTFGNSATVGQFDTFIVYYTKFLGGGSFTVSVDGGSSLGTITTNSATQSIASQTFTVTKGTHTINLNAQNNGQFYIAGILPYDGTTPAIDIIRSGYFGAQTSTFISTTKPWSFQNAVPTVIQPNLTIYALTINDSNNQGASYLPTYTANTAALIATGLQSGDVMLASGPPSNTANATNGTLAQYIAVLESLASANNLPFVNIAGRWGGYAAINGVFAYYDTLHPETLGYWDMAAAYQAAVSRP